MFAKLITGAIFYSYDSRKLDLFEKEKHSLYHQLALIFGSVAIPIDSREVLFRNPCSIIPEDRSGFNFRFRFRFTVTTSPQSFWQRKDSFHSPTFFTPTCILFSSLLPWERISSSTDHPSSATWCQFHQWSTSPLVCADPESAKKTDNLTVFFCAFRICAHKSCLYNVDQIDPWCQFHQHFTCRFYMQISLKLLNSVKLSISFCNFVICKRKSCE
jgi:hypothetical protein